MKLSYSTLLVVQIVLIMLKLLNLVKFSWLLVFIPLYIQAFILLLVLLTYVLAIVLIFKSKSFKDTVEKKVLENLKNKNIF